MKTKQFVETTITDILDALIEAQKLYKKNNCYPPNQENTAVDFNLLYDDDGRIISAVNNSGANVTSVKFSINIPLPNPYHPEEK